MSFTCTFYNISDPPNKLSKTLGTAIHTATCSPFNPMSDLHGEIIVDYNSAIEAANYCVIEAGTQAHAAEGRPRYCFITDLIKGNGGRLTVRIEEDVLMTFKDAIKELPLHVTRCSLQAGIVPEKSKVGYNSMIPDGTITMTAQKYFINIPFTKSGVAAEFAYQDAAGDTTNQYILAVIG